MKSLIDVTGNVALLFVPKEKKPKPHQDNYEGSLSLSVSAKSYELLIGKRTLTRVSLPRAMCVAEVPSVGICKQGF